MATARKDSNMMDSSVQGIYFHPQRHEILAVKPDAIAPGGPWVRFAEDHMLGLLAARSELQTRGLLADAAGVEWHGMSDSNPEERQQVANLIRALRKDSDRLRREAEARQQDFWHRLISALASPLTSRGEEA